MQRCLPAAGPDADVRTGRQQALHHVVVPRAYRRVQRRPALRHEKEILLNRLLLHFTLSAANRDALVSRSP